MASTQDEQRVPLNRESVTEMGGVFNGEEWMMAFPLADDEGTILVCATQHATMKRSAGRPTGVKFVFAETDYGPVAMMIVALFDDPQNPLTLDVMLNVATPGGRDLLEGLTGATLKLAFMDRHSGEGIGMRTLPYDPETAAGIRQAAALSAAFEERSMEDWQRASELMRKALGR